jgi:hypothetical protein
MRIGPGAMTPFSLALALILAASLPLANRAAAQGQYWVPTPVAAPPTYLSPAELEDLVARVALYPDELLAAVLPAATEPLQVVQAARFLDDRRHDPTLRARSDWDISIIVLLNYPDVLEMMNDDLDWTAALGDAVVLQRQAVMDAIQQFRLRVYTAGNLYSNDRVIVTHTGGLILIQSVDPEVIYVPVYNPARVLVPRPLLVPVIRYSPPYRAYYLPQAPFFTGLFFGIGIGFGFDWHRHHINVHRGIRVERRPGYRSRLRFDERHRWRDRRIERRPSAPRRGASRAPQARPRPVPPPEARQPNLGSVQRPEPAIQPQPRREAQPEQRVRPQVRRQPDVQPRSRTQDRVRERTRPRPRVSRPGDTGRGRRDYLGGYERGRDALRQSERGARSRAVQQPRQRRTPPASLSSPVRPQPQPQRRRQQEEEVPRSSLPGSQ